MLVVGAVAATLAGFLMSGLYYGLMPSASSGQAPDRSTASTIGVELARTAVVAAVMAGVLAAADVEGALAGGLFGLALWLLPVVLLAGSVFHEGTRPASAALHAGDWLLKLVVIGLILGIVL